MTDDRGAYRAYGLAPGSYVVFAIPPGRPPRRNSCSHLVSAMDAALSNADRSSAGITFHDAAVLPSFDSTVAYGPVFPPSVTHAGASWPDHGQRPVRSMGA
jgi:hypothetical protein